MESVIAMGIGVLFAVVAVAGMLLYVMLRRHRRGREERVAQLIRAVEDVHAEHVGFAMLDGLPAPVVRYFRYVLVDGQARIRLATYRQAGEIRLDPAAQKWLRFDATQWVTHAPVAFVWDAKIHLAPAFHVRVTDAFLAGSGSGEVALQSAIVVAREQNQPQLNAGELYRYLAEAPWHPTSLLPEAGVRWQAVDANTAIAHLECYGMTVSVEFRFNTVGEITSIYTADRYGRFDGDYVKRPWEGFFDNYQLIDGMRIPTEGRVGWHLPAGWWLFWKGTLVDVAFEYYQ